MRAYIALLGLFVAAGCSFSEERPARSTEPERCALGGPWSTSPEADWVREILRAGGYRAIGETGSAVVAGGKGHEFAIWAAEVRGASPGMPNWKRMATVRGVPVYGDRALWRSWRAQGFTFWVHGGGPTPAAGRLAPVVDASLRVPFRDPCVAGRRRG
jgi:hypothetical protein